MDSEIVHPHDHPIKHEPHNAGLHPGGEDREHPDENKSVSKKVKAKAKNLKDNLMHGHGHNEDHLHRTPDDHHLDEEDDDEEVEEILHDPEIQEASVFESGPIRSSYFPEKVEGEVDSRTDGRSVAMEDDYPTGKDFVSGGEEDRGLRVAVGKTRNINEVPHTPLNTPAPVNSGSVGKPEVIGPIGSFSQNQQVITGQPDIHLEGLEEDPHAPKEKPEDRSPSNYQSKVADATGEGRQELRVPSILSSFDKMSISSEAEPRAEENLSTRQYDQSFFSTGSHDQLSLEPIPTTPMTTQGGSYSVSESPGGNKQVSFSDKISSVTSAIANKAISVTNTVISKLKNGEGQKVTVREVAETSNPMMSKVPEVRSSPGNEGESHVKVQDKGMSIKDYLSYKLKPGDEDRALSEVISEKLIKRKQETKKTDQATGKMSESEEVQRQLESNEENPADSLDQSSVGIPGGVVLETGGFPQLPGKMIYSAASGEETGERRLQESGN